MLRAQPGGAWLSGALNKARLSVPSLLASLMAAEARQPLKGDTPKMLRRITAGRETRRVNRKSSLNQHDFMHRSFLKSACLTRVGSPATSG